MPLHYSLSLLAVLIVSSLSTCGSAVGESGPPTLYPTYTPYPTSTPYPTYTPISFDEKFLKDLLDRVQKDDTIPQAGKKTVISIMEQKPTYAFKHNQGIILQFNIPSIPEEPELKKTAILLMGTGIAVAGEHNIPLSGIEVVFYLKEGEPWLALALVPPWDVANDLRLAPLHPDYIKRLQEAGLITPIPVPTATQQPTY